ncbi:MAG TPA: thermonuclease family protein [Verrucomicrobiae bacterium]|nr:thermonuclease family protein [Verrucomicrobiae bacterium]
MFKALRKAAIVLVVLVICGIGYHFLANAGYRRFLIQRSTEWIEQLQDPKKFAWTGTAVVVDALKGDRLTVDTEAGHKVVVRLAGIDAPEPPVDRFHKGQPLAEESRDQLAQWIKGKAVEMSILKPDPEKHPWVLVTVDGELVNAKMISAGLAEVSQECAAEMPLKIRHQLENAELQAKEGRIGIWSLSNYVRPVEFRIRNKVIAGPRYGTD